MGMSKQLRNPADRSRKRAEVLPWRLDYCMAFLGPSISSAQLSISPMVSGDFTINLTAGLENLSLVRAVDKRQFILPSIRYL